MKNTNYLLGGIFMKKMKSFKVLLVVCLLIASSAIVAFASGSVLVLKGDGSGAKPEEGAHYYAFSSLWRRYSKISATIVLPGPEHQILDGTNGKRAAYISFGVRAKTGEGDTIDFGLARSTESPELNEWHVYACNVTTGQFERWTNYTYTGTQNISLETSIGGDDQTDVVFTVGNDRFDADDRGLLRDSSFVEWQGLTDNQFYRFVSLTPVNSSNTNIYDGTMHRGVAFKNLAIYRENVDSNNEPYGTPTKLSWGYLDSTVSDAFEANPDQIGVHEGVYDSEYINIKHEVNPEV